MRAGGLQDDGGMVTAQHRNGHKLGEIYAPMLDQLEGKLIERRDAGHVSAHHASAAAPIRWPGP